MSDFLDSRIANIRPGCWNKPRPKQGDVYYVLTRKYLDDGSGRYYLEDEAIPYRFNDTDCHHDQVFSDCTSCDWRKK